MSTYLGGGEVSRDVPGSRERVALVALHGSLFIDCLYSQFRSAESRGDLGRYVRSLVSVTLGARGMGFARM